MGRTRDIVQGRGSFRLLAARASAVAQLDSLLARTTSRTGPSAIRSGLAVHDLMV